MPGTSTSIPSNRRERQSLERRERLFRAALDLFAHKGFAETTVEDITNAADLGKGTFFNYFPSKEHILLAFAEMQLGKLRAAADEARAKNEPTRVFLRSLGARMTQEPIRNPSIIRILLQAFLSNTPVRESMMDLQARVIAIHTEIIRLGQQRGEIRDDLPAEVLANVFPANRFWNAPDLVALTVMPLCSPELKTPSKCSGPGWHHGRHRLRIPWRDSSHWRRKP